MRRFARVGLVCLLISLTIVASASPQMREARYELTFSLDGASEAFDEPIDRWITEITALLRVSLDTARWQGGARCHIEVWAGTQRAFDLLYQVKDGAHVLGGSLPRATYALSEASRLADLAEALIDGLLRAEDDRKGARETDFDDGRHASLAYDGARIADALTRAATELHAVCATARAQATADCGGCGACENCVASEIPLAAAAICEAMAECCLRAPEALVLTVARGEKTDAAAPADLSAERETAPDLLFCDLLRDAFHATVEAIAGNGAPIAAEQAGVSAPALPRASA